MTYSERVGHGHIRRQRALSNHAGAVHPVGTDLVDAVKVNTGGLVAKLVGEVDNDGVSHGGLDLGARPLAIDTNDGPRNIERGSVDPSGLPVVGHSRGKGRIGPSQGEERPQHNGHSRLDRPGLASEKLSNYGYSSGEQVEEGSTNAGGKEGKGKARVKSKISYHNPKRERKRTYTG